MIPKKGAVARLGKRMSYNNHEGETLTVEERDIPSIARSFLPAPPRSDSVGGD